MIIPTGPFRRMVARGVKDAGAGLFKRKRPRKKPSPRKESNKIDIVVLPCPCCGNDDLFVGPLPWEIVRIHCRECSLQLNRIIKPVVGEDFDQKDLEVYWLCKAIRAWNKRAH